MDITSAKAIVTGGASGLGGATARYLLSKGAQVTIFDRDADKGEAMAKETGAHFAEVDVSDEASTAKAVAAAKSAMGGITAVVNCAGIVTGASTLGKKGPFPLADFQRTIDINLVGSFNVARLAAEVMAENEPNADGERGVIVNTASVAAFDGQRGQAAYAASKAGIAGMSLPMARDLARTGIRVMAIAPGIFLTPMLESLGEDMITELSKDVLHPKRLGSGEEYARLAEFIISHPYLNAEVIRLDGGLRMQ
ncbi:MULTISPECIES: SDR family NAD(P)-dependent oxidoreductase [Halocynthiibacter]|uniref:SDR family NAD(P)-dependent oxidoreductase n=1 Tax=Halocynthiibacter halioticoli TaxID=2986804 RepID=A0AAE3IXU4_9RHOB|nr:MULTISPECIES: SDR family NAD(P)-dependent oxidoreductase [Halocynthiibacter]MCV6824242.1 SDR family NAD(P)-dependent oxidoreductase [Halocynthiibacter halioticoli]MCW4057243.1 SDR family NAD(P)-dependent oxidoreductase [Halocynthiibacter sp. SDUM655004]